MILQITDLEVGQRYFFHTRNIKIIKIDATGSTPSVTYEYFMRGDMRDVEDCSVKEFLENAYRDYANDPQFQAVYPFLASKKFSSPEFAATLLTRKISLKGGSVSIIEGVTALVEMGFRPGHTISSAGLFKEAEFIPVDQITKTGYAFARFLSRQQGWDGISVALPDVVLG
jgi:hypothetical protein